MEPFNAANLVAPFRSKSVARSDSKDRVLSSSTSADSRPFQFTARARPNTTQSKIPSSTASRARTPSLTRPLSTQLAAGLVVVRNQPTDGTRFKPYHKITTLESGRAAESQLVNRRINFAEATKERRAKVMNNNRKISNAEKQSSKDKDDTVDRKEKLMRWKREVLGNQKKQAAVKKPPMVVGIPQRKPNGLLDLIPVTKTHFVFPQLKHSKPLVSGMLNLKLSSAPTLAIKPASSEIPLNKPEVLKEAPTKQPTPLCCKTPPAKARVQNQPIDLEDEQNENENVPPTLVVPVQLNFDSPVKKASGVYYSPAVKKIGAVARSPAVKMSGGIQHSPAIKNIVGRSPAIKKTKKPKGMQMDSVYIDFHSKFVQEALTLRDYRDTWSKILEDDVHGAIPEEVVCEIEISVGQARLLFDSKLPQFGDLLYWYLTRTTNPRPTLAEDLGGWWDVASISIEKVKTRFVKLEKLSRNRWQPGERVPLKVL